jgi:hypothetical protein
MISRRTFVNACGAGIVGTSAACADQPAPRRRRMAVVTTEWRERSHAWHMAERFLHGYPIRGQWHRPPFDVVAAYVDHTPANDLSRDRARVFASIRQSRRRCGAAATGWRWMPSSSSASTAIIPPTGWGRSSIRATSSSSK